VASFERHHSRINNLRPELSNSGDLVANVATNGGLSRSEAVSSVETVMAAIADAIFRGEGVELRGFGSFRIRHRDARTGRNPKTGEVVEVPPKRIPYFKPGKDLREQLLDHPE